MMARLESDAASSRAPRLIAIVSVALLAFLAPGASQAGAESPWSATANAGIMATGGAEGGGLNLGGWAALLHTAASNWSVGGEAGYFTLPGLGYVVPAVVGYDGPESSEFSMLSASGVVRARTAGPVRAHLLGTFGYYDQVTRTHYVGGRPDRVEHEGHPGFSIGAGVSGSGLLRPGFQLRWHHVLRSRADYQPYLHTDAVTFEAGLHFN
jgi:hypothetical protein